MTDRQGEERETIERGLAIGQGPDSIACCQSLAAVQGARPPRACARMKNAVRGSYPSDPQEGIV